MGDARHARIVPLSVGCGADVGCSSRRLTWRRCHCAASASIWPLSVITVSHLLPFVRLAATSGRAESAYHNCCPAAVLPPIYLYTCYRQRKPRYILLSISSLNTVDFLNSFTGRLVSKLLLKWLLIEDTVIPQTRCCTTLWNMYASLFYRHVHLLNCASF